MSWPTLLVDLGRGVTVALIAAYLFSVAMLLVERPRPSDIVSLLVVATSLVLFALWAVLPAGVLLGYFVPRLAVARIVRSTIFRAGDAG